LIIECSDIFEQIKLTLVFVSSFSMFVTEATPCTFRLLISLKNWGISWRDNDEWAHPKSKSELSKREM